MENKIINLMNSINPYGQILYNIGLAMENYFFNKKMFLNLNAEFNKVILF